MFINILVFKLKNLHNIVGINLFIKLVFHYTVRLSIKDYSYNTLRLVEQEQYATISVGSACHLKGRYVKWFTYIRITLRKDIKELGFMFLIF